MNAKGIREAINMALCRLFMPDTYQLLLREQERERRYVAYDHAIATLSVEELLASGRIDEGDAKVILRLQKACRMASEKNPFLYTMCDEYTVMVNYDRHNLRSRSARNLLHDQVLYHMEQRLMLLAIHVTYPDGLGRGGDKETFRRQDLEPEFSILEAFYTN